VWRHRLAAFDQVAVVVKPCGLDPGMFGHLLSPLRINVLGAAGVQRTR
jgi:hypothetical protein